jgi:8-oxo-dGTP diphosphatase
MHGGQAQKRRSAITTAGIFRKGSLVLLAKRLPGGSMGGRWEFPGGKAEAGESPEETLKREIREEFGAEILVGAFLASTQFFHNTKEYTMMAFEAVLQTPIRELRAHEEIRWLAFEDIGCLDLADSDRRIYESLAGMINP